MLAQLRRNKEQNHEGHMSAEEKEERAAIVIQKRFRGMQERARFKRRQEEKKAEKRVSLPLSLSPSLPPSLPLSRSLQHKDTP